MSVVLFLLLLLLVVEIALIINWIHVPSNLGLYKKTIQFKTPEFTRLAKHNFPIATSYKDKSLMLQQKPSLYTTIVHHTSL